MSRIIHITHFVSPHCFYFKFDDDLHDNQLQDLEIEISKHARQKINENIEFKPADGDIVAAFVTKWSKWIRAQLRANLVDFERYELWSIDHGQIFQTQYKNVIPLPQNLIEREVKGVHQGCIHGISPAKLTLNMDTYKSELKACLDWSSRALEQCNDLINNQNVFKIFYDIQEQHDKHHFGHLYIETIDKKMKMIHKIDFRNVLIEIDQGIEVSPAEFNKDINYIVKKYAEGFVNPSMNSEPIVNKALGKFVTIADQSHNQHQKTVSISPSIVASTVAPSEIDGGITRMGINNRVKIPAPSVVQSTVAPSEIDGGITRMGINNRVKIPAPSVVQSTVVPSEIDGGRTRMQMNQNRTFNRNQNQNHNRHTFNGNNQVRRNGNPSMPAGYERDTYSFNKYNGQTTRK